MHNFRLLSVSLLSLFKLYKMPGMMIRLLNTLLIAAMATDYISITDPVSLTHITGGVSYPSFAASGA